jgi:hypothetical protein
VGNEVGEGQVQVGQVSLVRLQSEQVILQQKKFRNIYEIKREELAAILCSIFGITCRQKTITKARLWIRIDLI